MAHKPDKIQTFLGDIKSGVIEDVWDVEHGYFTRSGRRRHESVDVQQIQAEFEFNLGIPNNFNRKLL